MNKLFEMAFRSTLIFLFLFSVHASACTPSGKRLASCVCLWLMLPHVDAPHVLPSRPRLSLSGRSQASRTRALGPGRPWGPCAAARRAAGLVSSAPGYTSSSTLYLYLYPPCLSHLITSYIIHHR